MAWCITHCTLRIVFVYLMEKQYLCAANDNAQP